MPQVEQVKEFNPSSESNLVRPAQSVWCMALHEPPPRAPTKAMAASITTCDRHTTELLIKFAPQQYSFGTPPRSTPVARRIWSTSPSCRNCCGEEVAQSRTGRTVTGSMLVNGKRIQVRRRAAFAISGGCQPSKVGERPVNNAKQIVIGHDMPPKRAAKRDKCSPVDATDQWNLKR
jgi:hypothetical protein